MQMHMYLQLIFLLFSYNNIISNVITHSLISTIKGIKKTLVDVATEPLASDPSTKQNYMVIITSQTVSLLIK